MTEQGGLHTLGDVKALILYILKSAHQAISRNNITEIVLNDGLVDYFDFTQSIQKLLEEGLIDIVSADEPDILRITSLGLQTEELYEKNLPFNVKKKTLASLTSELAKIQRDSNTHTSIVAVDGGFSVTCTLTEQEKTLLSYTVLVPDEMQAHIIADQFVKAPTQKYQVIMQNLIDESLFN